MSKKTILERLQADIDRCNNKKGCNAFCGKQQREACEKLKKHSARMAECREKGLPIELW